MRREGPKEGYEPSVDRGEEAKRLRLRLTAIHWSVQQRGKVETLCCIICSCKPTVNPNHAQTAKSQL